MGRDVIAIGASAGGVDALRAVVAAFPPDLPATVLVVLHVPTYGTSALPAILARSGPLPARHLAHASPLTPGEIFVAPPDHHLVVRDGYADLTKGPRENGHRPAVDVLFRTAARALGPRVIGVVLSGVMDDGSAGLRAIQERGGLTVVQDPEDALYSGMPQSALEHVRVDRVAPADLLGKVLDELCRTGVPDDVRPPATRLEMEADLALMDGEAMNHSQRPGVPSGFSCPDCGGTLFAIRDGSLDRFRCRVGHAWSAETLLGEQSLQMESALWMALRSLEEKAALSRQLADRAGELGNPLSCQRFREQAQEAVKAANLVRTLLESEGPDLARRRMSEPKLTD